MARDFAGLKSGEAGYGIGRVGFPNAVIDNAATPTKNTGES
ncbi:hypothetical protein RSSM_03782 [Rhodopirellula sallentina SM41]|uniref:Uncharacterized protein n=1 Tax=Rhodopirellula sallentina SM41 TaxID=1263870 RepID=M5UFK3_9BACT|nr:hypothetical protein RSSM_03782 [Rhodopirellula sallentina SM41]